MALNTAYQKQKMQEFRATLRRYAQFALAQAMDTAGSDAELYAVLKPHADAFRDAAVASLANLTTAIQAISVTNADRVAYANELLAKDST